jgi:hypothetical protein
MLRGDPVRYRRTGDNRAQYGRLIEDDERNADRLTRMLMAPSTLVNVSLTTNAKELMTKFGLPQSQAELRLEELKRQYRKHHGIERSLPTGNSEGGLPSDVARMIDTGDYEEAMSEMLGNAARWNS